MIHFDIIGEIKRLLRPITPGKAIEKEIFLAQHALLQHESAAEYHAAMIGVQVSRLERLNRRAQEFKEADK
jgi:hypothetical protein